MYKIKKNIQTLKYDIILNTGGYVNLTGGAYHFLVDGKVSDSLFQNENNKTHGYYKTQQLAQLALDEFLNT